MTFLIYVRSISGEILGFCIAGSGPSLAQKKIFNNTITFPLTSHIFNLVFKRIFIQ